MTVDIMIIWHFEKGTLKTVGMKLEVDQIKSEKKKYLLFKTDKQIGELNRSEHLVKVFK